MTNQARKFSFWLGLLLLLSGSMFQACLKSKEPGIPLDVVEVIQNTGFNRVELTKTIARYFESDDSLKLKAVYFLIRNIGRQYSVEYELVDSVENIFEINPLSFSTEENFLNFWDSLETNTAGLSYRAKKYMLDRDTITSELLISTIENSFEARKFSWAKNYDFCSFLAYTLPYRIGNEHLEDWRSFLMHEFSWIEDSVSAEVTADEVAQIVNKHINNLFRFDLRYLKNPQEQKMEDFFGSKKGNHRDISYLKAKTLRSLGIPATVDYVPYLADTSHSFYFAVYLSPDGKFKPLPGNERDLLSKSAVIPKVYRRIYFEIDSSLFALKDLTKTTPPFLGHYHYLDVTADYLPVQTLVYNGFCPDTFIYISVFNDKKWRAVDWAICKNNSATFKNISKNINYKFSFLDDETSSNQIILKTEDPFR
ncbi:MAG: transglutaminase domain-containing protein [Bacteroidales bacterium]|nr:transglutaminase domain-containing protein [Bacteroidales bacterium]